MRSAFVLVHSPSVGPLAWAPVADRLRARGHECIVPSLFDVGEEGPPFWPRVVHAVKAGMSQLAENRPVLLAAHSNAGLFVPLLVSRAALPVRGCLFVNAALPALAEATPAAPAELLDFLRGKVNDGRLPPWTDWWDEEDVAPMFPDPQSRAVVTAEQPRLPLAYYEQLVPVPVGWNDAQPCGYLLFGAPYDEAAADARRRGWLVEQLPGQHLHQIVDPDATADHLISMARRLEAALR